jgi:hypothetical protein
MRTFLYGVALAALAILTSPDAIRSALAASASALFEATPFLFAGVLLSRVLQRRIRIVEYLGCGCGHGPAARSIPAAAATWLLFGPLVAIARFIAALLVAHVLDRRRRHRAENGPADALGELAAIVPAAVLAGVAVQFFAAFDPARLSPIGNTLLGVALGFAAAPCGLGAIALAGALHVRAPVAAAAFLCVAGVVDLRTLKGLANITPGEDAFGYMLLAAALWIVALRRGDALVHPAFAIVLGCCASAALLGAIAYRERRSAAARIAPALMLAGALLGAPPPAYRATETTLTDLFAGEQLRFTGALAKNGSVSAVVRYAITCCRADAAPIAVRLDRSLPYPAGTWLRVEGRIESVDGTLRLVPKEIERVAAPADPFLYR